MKKFFIILFGLFLMFQKSYALSDYSNYCSTTIPNKTFTGTLSSLTGVNFLTRNIVEYEISKSLKKEFNSKFKVNISNFWGIGLLDGIFKKMTITSKNAFVDGLYLSNINVSTVCEYNQVHYENKELTFRENMVLKFSNTITQDDLDKTVESSEFKKIIDKMNEDKAISAFFKIQSLKLLIKDEKIVFKYSILPFPKNTIDLFKKFSRPINVSFSSGLKVTDGKVEMYGLELLSKNANIIPENVLSMLNPLSYEVNVSKKKKSRLNIENIKIKDDKILTDGIVVILKD